MLKNENALNYTTEEKCVRCGYNYGSECDMCVWEIAKGDEQGLLAVFMEEEIAE